MSDLSGRVILVTGAARGIGEAIARRFISENASIIIADVRDDAGTKLATELGPRARFVHLDVTSETDWKVGVEHAREQFGKIDGLVNNAGIFEWCALTDYDLSSYRRVIEVNQIGAFLGMKTAAPLISRSGGGTIVNISSVAGIKGVANAIAYTASKFAVTGMTQAAAMELAPCGIRVNSVHPGFVRTPLTIGTGEEPGTMPSNTPGGADPALIANLVLYLTSQESAFSTGSQFVADGGDIGAGVAGGLSEELAEFL